MRVKVPEDVLVKVYELRDPRDEECKPRYVGITIKDLNSRLSGHIAERKRKVSTHKINWINKLLLEGVRPTIHLIEEVIGWENAYKAEKYYIKEFTDQGYSLTNNTIGGEGVSGYIFSKELVKQIRKKVDKIIIEKEKLFNSGVVQNKRTKKWESYLWINNFKVCLGTYGFYEDALEARKLFIKVKHEEIDINIDVFKSLVKEYSKKEWCRKLLLKPPSITYVKKAGRWKATTFHIGGKHKFLGEYSTKEEAIRGYYSGVKKHADEILNSCKYK